MITNSVDTLISEGRLLSWYIWLSAIDLLNWLFQSIFDQRSHITFMNSNQVPVQDIIPISSALSRYSRILYQESSHDWPTVLFDNSRVKPGQHNSLTFPMASSTWLLFNEPSSRFYSGVRLINPEFALGESIGPLSGWGGMNPKSIVHTSSVLSLHVLMFFLVWYLRACGSLSCFARKFAHPTSYMFVLRDTDQTIPLHESFQTHIAVDQWYFLALSQVQACQGPLFHYFFSHSPWTRPLPHQTTQSCLAEETANSPV